MKIALYGGTFDPIHIGHLVLARDAVEELGLDRLIFVPNIISPHKEHTSPADPRLRMEMVQAAVAPERDFGADSMELERGGTSYTIDTVLEIKERHPDADIFYLIGEDNIAELSTWRRIDELSHLAQFVVFSRGNPNAIHPYVTLRRRIDISATEIRTRIAKGLSVRYFVPDAVLAIIERHQLYRNIAPSNLKR